MTIGLGGTSPRAQASASTFEAGSTNTSTAQTQELHRPPTPSGRPTEYRPAALYGAFTSPGIWQDLLNKLRKETAKLVHTLLGSDKYATDDEVERNATGVQCMKKNIVRTTIMQNGESVKVNMHANSVDLSWASVYHVDTETAKKELTKKTYLVGQSPIPQANRASSFSGSGCEKFLLQGIDSGAGTFQFVSPPRPGDPVKWSSRSIISQLDNERKKNPGSPLLLGGRYQVNELKLNEEDHSNQHQHYQLSVTDVSVVPPREITIVLTQAGLNFDGKLLRAKEIRTASAIMDRHKELAGPTSSPATEPMIVSHAGIGRNATLVLYRELSAKIRENDFRDVFGGEMKIKLDNALEELIMQGRAARGPGFVHSEAQVRELANTLLEDAVEHEEELAADEKADAATAQQMQNGAVPPRSEAGQAFDIPKCNLRDNTGGGDCLFHAIAGTSKHHSLVYNAIKNLREKIATGHSEKTESPEQLIINRNEYDSIGVHHDLPPIEGKVSNKALADILRNGGTFASDLEIKLWLELEENKDKSVVVIDSQSGSESIITFTYDKVEGKVNRTARKLASQVPPWSKEKAAEEIRKSIEPAVAEEKKQCNSRDSVDRQHIALYRTLIHWKAITNY